MAGAYPDLPRAGYKKLRLGPELSTAASHDSFLQQVHVIFGGTGATGGATALHLVSLLEEVMERAGSAEGHHPRVVVTARTAAENRRFTSLLFKVHTRDYGIPPRRLDTGGGYRTRSGLIVEQHTLAVDPTIPELAGFSVQSEERRREALHRFLEHGGLPPEAPVDRKLELLKKAVAERVGRPFTEFLTRYREEREEVGEGLRFRSVVVAIPLASVANYKLEDLETAGSYLGVKTDGPQMRELKRRYLRSLRDDLAHVAGELADEVLVAHTTAVGGMYDEAPDGTRTIRLGFAHTAHGADLFGKQVFAEELARLYSERGIKMLVTAAAIGIDAVLVDKSPPMNGRVLRQLRHESAAGHEVVPEADWKNLHVYAPEEIELLEDDAAPLVFRHGAPLVVDYVVRSGENGLFSVSNADAIYRVMRVTSTSELGLLLARTALFGDDPLAPSFHANVCNYTETDNSRQVFDLLYQPELLGSQLAGLSPKALQDLGSAKHQAELHLLGLLILLHRLETLDLEAIPPGVDLARFDPDRYFETHSRPLSLERVAGWNAEALSRSLTLLATARQDRDLDRLKHFFQADPKRQEAVHRLLQRVLRAVWAVPSLGVPLVYEVRGLRRFAVGPFAAPVDRVLTHRDTLARHLRQELELSGARDDADFDRFVEFKIASSGFVDLRPVAVLVTARSPAEGLEGRVRVFREEAPYLEALAELEPYSFFTTSGVLALLVRLRGLYNQAQEFDPQLGSMNDFRSSFLRDEGGRHLLVPGLVEAHRMVSEGLDKNTGSERLHGRWGHRIR